MKVQIRPAAKSTPERPTWVWRVFDGSREVAFGITFCEADAHEQAKRARDARRRELGLYWEIEADE